MNLSEYESDAMLRTNTYPLVAAVYAVFGRPSTTKPAGSVWNLQRLDLEVSILEKQSDVCLIRYGNPRGVPVRRSQGSSKALMSRKKQGRDSQITVATDRISGNVAFKLVASAAEHTLRSAHAHHATMYMEMKGRIMSILYFPSDRVFRAAFDVRCDSVQSGSAIQSRKLRVSLTRRKLDHDIRTVKIGTLTRI